jgi:CBS-domain-containing membrane protein
MQVVDMMRKTVTTAPADMSLAQAQQRMQEHRIAEPNTEWLAPSSRQAEPSDT